MTPPVPRAATPPPHFAHPQQQQQQQQQREAPQTQTPDYNRTESLFQFMSCVSVQRLQPFGFRWFLLLGAAPHENVFEPKCGTARVAKWCCSKLLSAWCRGFEFTDFGQASEGSVFL